MQMKTMGPAKAVWDASKAVQRGKFIAMYSYIRNKKNLK